jgi:Carboxypeptidase regulatory-like domain
VKQLCLSKLLPGALFLSLLSIASTRFYAQASACSISGVVSDSTGASIPEAKVTITNQGTSVLYVETTHKSGFYSAEGLTVGMYSVEVTKSGFKESHYEWDSD